MENALVVSSATSVTGNLGGLAGADATCQRLAAAAGGGARTWRAYLSVERDRGMAIGRQTRATDRQRSPAKRQRHRGRQQLDRVACASGDRGLFVDEHGQRSTANGSDRRDRSQHDILTGSNADGTLAPGLTCARLDLRHPRCRGTGRSCRRSVRAGHAGAWRVEFRARQPELRGHGPARRRGPLYCFAR